MPSRYLYKLRAVKSYIYSVYFFDLQIIIQCRAQNLSRPTCRSPYRLLCSFSKLKLRDSRRSVKLWSASPTTYEKRENNGRVTST